MRLKKLAPFVIAFVSTGSMLAHADITIMNNTDATGTGKFNSICSGVLGDKGKAKPHHPFTVSKSILAMFCNPNCTAHIYLNDTYCTGAELATVQINIDTGITNVDNHDTKHYTITPNGDTVTIDPVSSWDRFFNWLR